MPRKKARRSRARVNVKPITAARKLWPNLIDIPLETLMRILHFVDPMDIISLRKCCRILYTATMERTAWTYVVGSLCSENHISRHTFPIDDMSLSELQYTATCLPRFESLLHRGGAPFFAPTAIRILKPYSDPSLDESDALATFRLIPGGRYLVTSSFLGCVSLWDLGFNPDKRVNHNAIASIDLEGLDDYGETLVQSTSDGLGILVAVASESKEMFKFRVLQVCPQSESPGFIQLGIFSYERPDNTCVRPCSFHRDKLTCILGEIVIVWNFVLNYWVKWSASDSISNIIVSEDTVLVLDDSQFHIYDIPPLQPYVRGTDICVDHKPLLSMAGPKGVPILSVPSIWMSGSPSEEQQPQFFDVLSERKGLSRISRYVLQPVANPGKGLARIMPIKIDSIRHEFSVDRMEILSGSVHGNRKLISWVHSHSNLCVNMFTTSSNPARKLASGRLYTWAYNEAPDLHYAFDLFAARLCVSSWDGEIRILDFI